MLDTNVCVDIMRERGDRAMERLSACEPEEVAVSVISYAELLHGAEKSAKPAHNHAMVTQFLTPIIILPFSIQAANHYARIRAHLERASNIIGPMDLLIAAHALAEEATLVTNNEREFQRVPGLAVENWVVAD